MRLLFGRRPFACSGTEIREKLIAQATDPVGSTPEEFRAFRKCEEVKWARVIKQANIRPN